MVISFKTSQGFLNSTQPKPDFFKSGFTIYKHQKLKI